ncbi:MAG: hypothetical protein GTO08_10555, partial [Deltaproteobacteria bacterium]|nr:hypothetical protein [Deltaproteobacteria bacterium]
MKKISRNKIALITCLSIILSLLVTYAGSESGKSIQSPDFSRYVGSEKCRDCHQIHYKGWVKTFHSTVIQDA